MKKVILLTALLACAAVNAQELVWENTFDTPEERAGWTFYDGNNNNNTWNIGKHVVRKAATPNMYEEVSPDNVLRYSAFIPNVVGGPANLKTDNFSDFEDWVISPEIDLTGASGTITLAAMIGRASVYSTTSASNNTSRHVFVYVSTPTKPVPDGTDFKALRTDIIAAYDNGNINVAPKILNITNADYVAAGNALFAQATADLSQYAGQKIYIGFWNNITNTNRPIDQRMSNPFLDTDVSTNFQIDEMQVYAETFLSVSDFEAKKSSKIIQNPVGSDLVLQLDPSLTVEATSVAIYNMMGQQVLSSAYAPKINVNTLAQGTYILRITNGNTTETLRFIKK